MLGYMPDSASISVLFAGRTGRLSARCTTRRHFYLASLTGLATLTGGIPLLIGCSGHGTLGTTSSIPSSFAVRGIVRGGQEPVTGATIQLYAAGTTGDGSAATPLLQNPAQTDPSGSFVITSEYTCPSATAEVYLAASGGNPGLPSGQSNPAIAMMTALGQCGSLTASTYITVNEVTTIGSLAALYPYVTSISQLGSGSSDAAQLATAFALVNEYVNTATGTTPGPTLPGGSNAPSLQINTLADILATCVNSSGGVAGDNSPCGNLFSLATPQAGSAPIDIFGTMLNTLENPSQNVTAIFNLIAPNSPFQPVLSAAPTSWALPIVAASGVPAISSFSGSPSLIAAGSSTVLSWNVGNASSIAITPGSFSTSTLVGSTTVSPTSTTVYTITATNGAGTSTAATSVSVATPPIAPGSLTVGSPTTSTVALAWASSTPNNGATISSYAIYRGLSTSSMAQVATTPNLAYTDTNLAPSTTYFYYVTAEDSVGNVSAPTPIASATTLPPIPAIGSFVATPSSITAGQSSVLSWTTTNATSLTIDNGVGNVTGATSTTVSPTSTTVYTLTASNSAGTGTAQAVLTVSPDTQPPSVPANLAVTATTAASISLSWTASTDPIYPSSQLIYNVFRNGTEVATTATGATSYQDTGLAASTTYAYTVDAYDPAGNISAQSAAVPGTTQASEQIYSTNFPLTENPISENGNWVGGQSAGGNLWGNVQTASGTVFGVSQPTTFGDPTAILTGTWSPIQSATATTAITETPTGNCCHEVEVRLRMNLSPSTITGYEVYCSVMPSPNNYCYIASWGGPNGSYNNLTGYTGPLSTLVNGDVLEGTVTGSTPTIITGYVNGTEIMQVTDTGQAGWGPWTSGNPGIGFYDSQDNNWNDFAFSSFTATASSAAISPPGIASFSATPANIMVGGTSTLSWSVTNADSVSITPGTFTSSSLAGSMTVNPAASTTYTLTATNDNGTAIATTAVSVGGPPWAYIQSNAQNSKSDTNTLAFVSPNQAGDLIIAEVDWTGGASFGSIEDSQGNTYTEIGTQQTAAGVQSMLYYATNVAAGANSVTTVVSGSPANHELYINEYSGLSTPVSLDSYSVNAGSGATFTSNIVTTTAANDLLFGLEIDTSEGAASSGWTTRLTLDGNVDADENAASTGSYAFTGTSGGASLAWIAAFK